MLNWIMGIAGALVAALLTLLSFSQKKLHKTKHELEEKREEIKLQQIMNSLDKELQEISDAEEKNINESISEIKKDTEEKLSDDSVDYNELIRNWNNEGK